MASQNKNRNRNRKTNLELLAPAGSIEVFEAAVLNGADAVYIGAPFLNARALAKNFTYAEIAAMTYFAHSHGVKVYIAMNSLLKDKEVRDLIKSLITLSDIGIDALIIQDIGIFNIVKKYFPNLRVHASTLCTVHNSLGVAQMESMGFDRTVLAREMTLKEVAKAQKLNKHAEIETFVHGAMCFSYSGLCLFSSFLGGKSGLRGRCVQPCRRRYSWQGKGKGTQSGYFFSMNDLEGIDLISDFFKAGITSLKLEGRMRSSHYVGSVVKAYRMVLDFPADRQCLARAKEILRNAMGRKSSFGYFKGAGNPGLIAHNHSGNIGLYVGKFEIGGSSKGTLVLKENIRVGDRFRIHLEKDGERKSFTLRGIRSSGENVSSAKRGTKVQVELPVLSHKGDSLYKVNCKEARELDNKRSKIDPGRFRKLINPNKYKQLTNNILNDINTRSKSTIQSRIRKPKFSYSRVTRGRRSNQRASLPLPWWLKTNDLHSLKKLNGPSPDCLVLQIDSDILGQIKSIVSLKKRYKKLILSLPPIIEEEKLDLYAKALPALMAKGLNEWQIGHIGQLQLFKNTGNRTVRLYGDFSLNILNSLTVDSYRQLGLAGAQISIEADRECIEDICKKARGMMKLGLTVYGSPPLFTARPTPKFLKYNSVLVSPKGEKFSLKKSFGQTIALSEKPFSLLPWVYELAEYGLDYFVIDLTNMNTSRGVIPALMKKAGEKKKRHDASYFNYLGKLY